MRRQPGQPQEDYDSNFLDNYAQINVVDVLKRIRGISDVSVFGLKYAMRIWLDPDRMANERISPDEVINAIKAENRQAAAGKIGGPPVPAGQRFEYPVTAKGRLSMVPEFEKIIVRARPDGSKVYLGDIGRVELGSETYDTGRLSERPGRCHDPGLPVFECQRPRHRPPAQARDGPAEKGFPADWITGSSTIQPNMSSENIDEVEHTLLEAFGLVLLVVFLFLQGLRTTLIPLLAIPVSLVATFALMASFGFSINTLTLMGLVLAIGLVVDDAIIVVENVEKYLERGYAPLEATRAAMAEITAPIITITLVLGAVFVPVAFIPGLTGRLYNQFALTIVFSFLFSAMNSLTFSPAMARLLLKAKTHHGESGFFLFRWFNRGMGWLENSYDSFLEYTAHHWWTIVVPSLGLLALTGLMLMQRPKSLSRSRTRDT